MTDEQLRVAQKFMASNFEAVRKGKLIRDTIYARLCCQCGDIPAIQVSYPLGRASMIEYYCSRCSETIFERLEKEPKESAKQAEYYGCQIGNIRAHDRQSIMA